MSAHPQAISVWHWHRKQNQTASGLIKQRAPQSPDQESSTRALNRPRGAWALLHQHRNQQRARRFISSYLAIPNGCYRYGPQVLLIWQGKFMGSICFPSQLCPGVNTQSSCELCQTGRRHLELQDPSSPIQTVLLILTGISVWDWSVLCVCLFACVCAQLCFLVVVGNSHVCVSHILFPSVPSFETWPRADLLILSPSLPTALHQSVRAQLHCLCSDHHPPKHRHSPHLNHGRHLTEHKEMHRGLKLDKCWQEQGFAP